MLRLHHYYKQVLMALLVNLSFLSLPVLADLGCNNLDITYDPSMLGRPNLIADRSDSDCIHGKIVAFDPGNIQLSSRDGGSYGPDCIIVFKGVRAPHTIVKIRFQQNYCFTEGGDITIQPFGFEADTDVERTITEHAEYSGTPGKIKLKTIVITPFPN